MTKMIQEVGSDTGDEKRMIDQRQQKTPVSSGRDTNSDPLGPNSEIGRKLRQYYDELISEEVPDRFTQLLSELEQREHPRSAAKET